MFGEVSRPTSNMFDLLTQTPTNDVFSLLADASGPMLMAIIIWGAIKEWWVPGAVFRRVLAERDEWKTLALASRQLTERTVNVAETIVDKTE